MIVTIIWQESTVAGEAKVETDKVTILDREETITITTTIDPHKGNTNPLH